MFETGNKDTRRGFIKKAFAAVLASVLLPRMLYAKAKKVAFSISKAENLKEVGATSVLEIKGEKILFIRVSETEVKGLSSNCTHQKCDLKYNKQSQKIECQCHGSKFDTDGKVLNGPAEKDLRNYSARLDGERIILEIEE
ncbi:MAG: hypothetical protein Kow0090_02750 [Myxococcota bacterium]